MEPANNPADASGATVNPAPCGLGRRLLAMTYDAVVLIAVLMLATALAMAAGFGGRVAMVDPGFTLYLAGVWYLYFAWFWHRGGMTLGMRAWRVRIEDDSGQLPGWGACTVRFAAALVSAAVLGAGFIGALFDRDKRTWHDRLSRTRLYVRRRMAAAGAHAGPAASDRAPQ